MSPPHTATRALSSPFTRRTMSPVFRQLHGGLSPGEPSATATTCRRRINTDQSLIKKSLFLGLVRRVGGRDARKPDIECGRRMSLATTRPYETTLSTRINT